MFALALTLDAAEPAAIPTDRLTTNNAVGPFTLSRNARFHTEFQTICSLILVAPVAILPRFIAAASDYPM